MREVGAKVVKDTERPDVTYQFYLLDSPMVNAFALPGGYIYMTRGLLALANSEAEMAAVLAHEAGHITGRHSAERYSRGVVTSLGAAVLATAIGSSEASQVLGVGSDLYLKSYSRGQESEADLLGLRYMTQAGYNPRGMAIFLSSLQADTVLSGQIAGRGDGASGVDYFSTHPATQERVANALTASSSYPQNGLIHKEEYLRRLDGMIYGDSAAQGFVRGANFYHPQLGFAFSAPQDYQMVNQPDKVVASSKAGELVVFDMVRNARKYAPLDFLRFDWMQVKDVPEAQEIDVNGMRGATAAFSGNVNGRPMVIRLVAIAWKDDLIARFQLAYPVDASNQRIEDLKRTTYSFKAMSASEKESIRPYKIKVVSAQSGDTVDSLASRMALRDGFEAQRFRVLNGLGSADTLAAGQMYKIIVE